VIDRHWVRARRLVPAALALLLVGGACGTSATGAGDDVVDATPVAFASGDGAVEYPDAPREISKRWWLIPAVADAPPSSDPQERAAADVLQSFFGSDSAEAMAPVSVGPAGTFADFMIIMQAISGRHPMEEVISRRVPRIVDRKDLPDMLVDAEISEDRSTGSGIANRTTFDQFVMRVGPDGGLRLVEFRRDGVWISELVIAGDAVRSADTGGVNIVAVLRSRIGRYMVAGTLDGVGAQRWSLDDARLESVDGDQQAVVLFSEIGVTGPDGLAPFLITFDDGGSADRGAQLILPPLGTDSPQGLVFDMPPLGGPRGGDSS